MILERIRDQIKTCGRTRYKISQDTGVDQATLCRIMQGGSCMVETADLLLQYFGLEVAKRRPKRKAR